MVPATWLAAGLVAAAAAATRAAAAPGEPGVAIAGYTPVTNVSAHARIDLDVKAIEEAGTDYAAARQVYTAGANSAKDGGQRTLQGFSTAYAVAGPARAEPLAAASHAFWGDWDYANRHVLAALAGNDSATYGDYGSGVLAADAAARTQVIKKVIKFSLIPQYVQHELEEALASYTLGQYEDAAMHWDEGWAFYAGSLEGGNGTGYSAYILAEKRARNFNTTVGAQSSVNVRFLAAMAAGQGQVAVAGNAAALLQTVKCIRGLMAVPPIQGCLRYAYKVAAVSLAAELPKEAAEAWAFCAAALPGLAAVDPAVAAAVRAETFLSGSRRAGWPVVRAAFGAATLNAMGVRCADVGTLNAEYPASAHPVCEDGVVANDNQGTDFC